MSTSLTVWSHCFNSSNGAPGGGFCFAVEHVTSCDESIDFTAGVTSVGIDGVDGISAASRDGSRDLRVFLSILLRLSDPNENWVLGYFGYADFKNLISFALGRRILEIAIFARNTVLQVLIIKKGLKLILLESA